MPSAGVDRLAVSLQIVVHEYARAYRAAEFVGRNIEALVHLGVMHMLDRFRINWTLTLHPSHARPCDGNQSAPRTHFLVQQSHIHGIEHN